VGWLDESDPNESSCLDERLADLGTAIRLVASRLQSKRTVPSLGEIDTLIEDALRLDPVVANLTLERLLDSLLR
jgi:hypothetical protein